VDASTELRLRELEGAVALIAHALHELSTDSQNRSTGVLSKHNEQVLELLDGIGAVKRGALHVDADLERERRRRQL
jgi:hypothetical protein